MSSSSDEDAITERGYERSASTLDSRRTTTTTTTTTSTFTSDSPGAASTFESSSFYEDLEGGTMAFYQAGSDAGTEPPTERQRQQQARRVAAHCARLDPVFAARATDREKEEGFRRLRAPDVRYLGFVPGERKGLPFLNVQPLVYAKPRTDFAMHCPVSWTERTKVAAFFLVFAAFGTGVALFLRHLGNAPVA